MNIVCSGGKYQIFGEGLQTYDRLPLGTYEIQFNKFMGFFLSTHTELESKEEKIYGSTPAKVEKVLKGFEMTNRNFGVILSGKKGIGKSLFARVLGERARDYNLPLIICSGYIPGIADFISSIEQEVIVLFDEFEKTFSEKEDYAPQEEMLSLFDGIDAGKKLFIITCNEVNKLNSYLLNRPGRFHYHFILTSPTAEEVREYMLDKLKEEYHDNIDRLIRFAASVEITYDMLRAIAFELNCGYTLEETLADLNIAREKSAMFTALVKCSDGVIRQGSYYSDGFGGNISFWVRNSNNRKETFEVSYKNSDITFDAITFDMYVLGDKVSIYVDRDDFDLDDEEEKAIYENLNKISVERIDITKSKGESNSGKYYNIV